MPFNYTCQRCGVEFTRKDRPNRKSSHRFCSVKCFATPRPALPGPDGSLLVPLTQGKFAVIDAEDAYLVLPYNWHLTNNGYAARKTETRQGVIELMHRAIMNPPTGVQIDHINRDKLYNRQRNLRLATNSQNNTNCGPHAKSSSGLRGVTWDKSKRLWMARITVDGHCHNLGRFPTEIEAARARDDAAVALCGEFAWLNFPEHPE